MLSKSHDQPLYYRQSSRLNVLNSFTSTRTREVMFLVVTGVVAAALSAFVKLHLQIPGHAILKVALPLSLGFAAVPRQHSGSIMGASALCSGLLFRWGFPMADQGLGLGAFTSLVLFGPFLDLSIRYLKHPVSAWVVLSLVGLSTNAGAFLARSSFKVFGKDHALGRLFAEWLSVAMFSYAICGLIAGLLSGIIFFRYQASSGESV